MTPRKYKVWWPDQDQTKDDARVFEGFDHEHAASEWAEWYDHQAQGVQSCAEAIRALKVKKP